MLPKGDPPNSADIGQIQADDCSSLKAGKGPTTRHRRFTDYIVDGNVVAVNSPATIQVGNVAAAELDGHLSAAVSNVLTCLFGDWCRVECSTK